MKIRQKIIGSLIALGAFGTLLGPGCADNRSSIFIIGALAVPQDTCVVEATNNAETRFAGRLDVALSREYWIPVLVGNQLVRRGNAATLRTETSHVNFYEAEVNLTDSAGAAIANGNFIVPVTGFAEAAQGVDPGLGVAAITLIDPTSAQSITPGQIIANIILRGESLGGVEVETDSWAFPITVCNGCSIFFPGDADDPARPGVDCDVRDDAPGYCRLGMDEGVDCRSCSAVNAALCRP